MSTKPKKRSLTLKGHRTSVSLEDKFWEEFCKIAERQNISINELASIRRHSRTKLDKFGVFNKRFSFE